MLNIMLLLGIAGGFFAFDSIFSNDEDETAEDSTNTQTTTDTDTSSENFLETTDAESVDGLENINPSDFDLPDVSLDEPIKTYRSGAEDSYNIDLEFRGNWKVEQQEAFVQSAEFLSKIIESDIPDHVRSGIDDLKIQVFKDIDDGLGGSLAYAGPDNLRTDSNLPYTATMVFDRADVDYLIETGGWASTILHEMLHALGFGTIWGEQGLVQETSDGVIRFTGANATAVYTSQFEDSARDPNANLGVPLDEVAGHWDEDDFGTEIMTGFLNSGEYLSNMTLAALEDMGYDTVFNNAAA